MSWTHRNSKARGILRANVPDNGVKVESGGNINRFKV